MLDVVCLVARDAIGATFNLFAGVAVSALLPTLQRGFAPMPCGCLSKEDQIPTGEPRQWSVSIFGMVHCLIRLRFVRSLRRIASLAK